MKAEIKHKQKLPFGRTPSRNIVAALTFAIFLSLTLASWSIVKDLQERNAMRGLTRSWPRLHSRLKFVFWGTSRC